MTEAWIGRHQIRVEYRPAGAGADWSCSSCSTGGGGPKADVERAVYAHLGIQYDSRVEAVVQHAKDHPRLF